MFKLVVDCSTGNSSYIPLTEEEIADSNAQAAKVTAERERISAAAAAEAAARESARAKLAALGLTEAEVAALVK